MAILYGDGAPSPLVIDYLDYLRRMIAMAVEVLLVEDQLLGAARRRRAVHARSAALEARLESLRLTVRTAVGGIARSPEDDPVTHCANHIEGEVDAVVARATATVRKQDDAASAAIAARERKAHATCLEAVEAFLRVHDLPGASLEVELEPAGAGHRVILRGTTPYHVASELELDPRGSPFAGPEVRAGSLSKARISELKLDRLVVVGARCDAEEIALRLRTGREPRAEGFDLTTDRAGGGARLTRIGRQGASEAIEPSPDDRRGLGALATAAAAALDALAGHRLRLRGVTLDDAPLDEHERPSQLIDRVFAAMAPQVRAIVEHSKVPGELSLRRELGDGRREEIFVAHARLAELVGQVPAGRRRHFDPLGLPGLPIARPPTAAEASELSGSEPSISIVFDEEPASDG